MPEQISPGNDQASGEIQNALAHSEELDLIEEPEDSSPETQRLKKRLQPLSEIIREFGDHPEALRRIREFAAGSGSSQLLDNESRRYNQLIKQFPVIRNDEVVSGLFQHIENGLSVWKSRNQAQPLSDEERADLINATVAHQVLLYSNLLLAFKAAPYHAGSMSGIDAIQEGIIGLHMAIAGFDYTKKFKFSTYATVIIEGHAKRAVANQSRAIRLPVHAHDDWQKMQRRLFELSQKTDFDPNNEAVEEELAKLIGKSVINVRRYLKAGPYDLPSLDVPVSANESDGDTVGDLLLKEQAEGETFSEQVIAAVAIETVFHSKSLADREKFILAARFGIMKNIPALEVKNSKGRPINYKRQLGQAAINGGLNTTTLAKVLGLSLESVRQIYNSAIKKALSVLEPAIEPEPELEASLETETEASAPPPRLYYQHYKHRHRPS